MRKRTKKFLALFLSLAMALSLMVPVSFAAGNYSDTTGHWASGAIDTWSDYGVIQGSDGQFRPNASISRAEMATIAVNALGLTEEATNTFSDVPAGQWYTSAILRANAAGILQGSDGQARPLATITRQEAMVIFARALAVDSGTAADLSAFADAGSVASWAVPSVAGLVKAGIVNGVTATSVAPTGNIDRASVVTILNNAVVQYINTPGTYELKDGKGIILVASSGVTLTGTTSADILVTPAADNGTINFEGATVTGKITVQADNAKVNADEASSLPTITYTGTGSSDNASGTDSTDTDKTTTNKNTGSNDSSVIPSNPVVSETKTDPVVEGNNLTISKTTDLTKIDTSKTYDTVTIDSTVEDITLTGLNMKVLDVQGGTSNSIHLSNCAILEKITAQKVQTGNAVAPRIFLKGTTSVPKIEVITPAIIEAEDGVPTIANIIAKAKTTIQGAVKVTIVAIYATEGDTTPVAVDVKGGTIDEVTANAEATISVDSGATVTNVTAKDDVTIESGTVQTVTVPDDAAEDVKVSVAAEATVNTLDLEKNAAVEANGTIGDVAKSSNEITVDATGTNGTELAAKVESAHVHQWSDGVETTPADCGVAGVMTYTCNGEGTCTYENNQKTEPIAAKEHNYVLTDSKAATATEDGYETYVCSNNSSHTYTNTIPATGETETPGDNTTSDLATLSPNFNNGKFELSNTLTDTANLFYKFVRGAASQIVSIASFGEGTFAANLVEFANLSSHKVDTYTANSDTSSWTLLASGIYESSSDTTYYVSELTTSPYAVSSDTRTTLSITIVSDENGTTVLSNTADPTIVVNEQIAAYDGSDPQISYADSKLTITGLTSGTDYAVLIKQGSTVKKVVATAGEANWSAALPDGITASAADTSVYIVKLAYDGTTITATGLGTWRTDITGWSAT